MRFTLLSTLLILATPFLAKASIVSTRGTIDYVETQADFDKVSAYMTQTGRCRSYGRTDRTEVSLSTCTLQCANAPQSKNGKELGVLKSTACMYSTSMGGDTFTSPDKLHYKIGKCECNVESLDFIVGTFVGYLPAIGQVACAVLFNVFDKVIEIGLLAIPGEGAIMDASMQAGIRAAKTILENGEKASTFAKWFNPCGPKVPGAHDYAADVDKIFDVFNQVPDKQVKGNGCGSQGKGKCPTPAKKKVA
ncbi:hypothetical protein B0J14DRAFT_682326 [Halenospora varia]|nr:hypothetical protein B0J14DRAFT_682326 [Halenospora varia]